MSALPPVPPVLYIPSRKLLFFFSCTGSSLRHVWFCGLKSRSFPLPLRSESTAFHFSPPSSVKPHPCIGPPTSSCRLPRSFRGRVYFFQIFSPFPPSPRLLYALPSSSLLTVCNAPSPPCRVEASFFFPPVMKQPPVQYSYIRLFVVLSSHPSQSKVLADSVFLLSTSAFCFSPPAVSSSPF